MSKTASLEDMRGAGVPKDIGTYVLPTNVIIYQATFSGTTYVCAARAGERGWVLVGYLPVGAANNTTVINAGIAALTAGRTWKERVVLIGNYTTNASIAVLSYTILEIYGKITATVGAYAISLVNRNDVEVIGGYIDGANVTNSGVGITGAGSTRILISRVDIYNANAYGVQIGGGASEVIVSKCHINVFGDDGIAITGDGTQKILVEGNKCHGGTSLVGSSSGVEVGDHADNIIISHNICYSNIFAGVNVNTHTGTPGVTNVTIVGNWCYNNGLGVAFTGVSGQIAYYCSIVANICYSNTDEGITISFCEDVTVVGNISRNNTNEGIRLANAATRVTVKGNTVRENGGVGIHLSSGSPLFCIVSGNTCHLNSYDGIGAYFGQWFIITDNICTNNSQRGAGLDSGITVAIGDVLIEGNICTDTQGAKTQQYGIEILAGAVRTIVGRNILTGNRTACISDLGTDTKLPTLTLPFVAGTEVIAAAGAPKGWRVDAANEYAIAFGVMPPECQQSVRMKVWAVGLAAPGAGNEMLVDIEVNSGQPDETYNAEAISVASKPNNETNFDVNDVISWTITATDDTDVDDLLGGDCFEFKVIYRAAVAPDIATNALFRCVEIMFV